MDLRADIVKTLKSIATVPVFEGVRSTGSDRDVDSILINTVKLQEVVETYEFLYRNVHRAWSNLPEPPECDMTFVVAWLLMTEGYCINHCTISWPGANSNSFVHLWSIMDRMRQSLESTNMNWLLGSRDCVGYSEVMGMTGPIDTRMYPREIVTPHQIVNMRQSRFAFVRDDTPAEFLSFYDMHVSTMVNSMRKEDLTDKKNWNKIMGYGMYTENFDG